MTQETIGKDMGKDIAEMAKDPERNYTHRQLKFMDLLFDPEFGGDYNKVKVAAGYSPNININEVLGPLRDEIREMVKNYMLLQSPQAMGKLVQVMRDGTRPGAKNEMDAAEKILDRSGISKIPEPEKTIKEVRNIFIMPPTKQQEIIEDVEYEDVKYKSEIDPEGDLG